MQPIRIIAILLVCLALSPLAPAQAEAVKINPPFDVNTTGDNGESNPGNCICETISATSFCTLRAAIQEANACAGDNDILLNNGVTYVIGSALTVHPASESPTEAINLYTDGIEGAKAIIKGSGDENYLAFSSGMGTLNITNITISDSNGISVALDATLNLNKVLMTDNHGNTGGTGDERDGGGAIQQLRTPSSQFTTASSPVTLPRAAAGRLITAGTLQSTSRYLTVTAQFTAAQFAMSVFVGLKPRTKPGISTSTAANLPPTWPVETAERSSSPAPALQVT